ncbi:PDR/VanB family oxidoreductase [Marinobacterium litorale]|uniref:PDR/VanB family oxidoreductase n=1 Tax=Marinobacterium litorale TaxID=404770 RepID=UPI00042A7767|nr:PDR/VanB family oxidoreductase [Marinobacterium litorale]
MNAKSFDHSQELSLVLRKITFEGKSINSYEFVDPDGKDLPPFEAGSHIDIKVSSNVTRQYSLCNDPSETHRYVIAVLRDENGRGGSKAIHDQLKVQDIVTVSLPRNNFELSDNTKRAILIGGGIGITPLKSMAHKLRSLNIPYELHYCAKDKTCVAFYDEICALSDNENVHFHFDGGDPNNGLNLQKLFESQRDGDHLYYCGPSGFMEACKTSAAHWTKGTVHFEHFKAPVAPKADSQPERTDGYKIKLNSTGEVIEVAAGVSVLEALQNSGVEVERSCESGLCGACKIRFLEGEVDHQDYILDDEERSDHFTSCVSRVTSDLIVLDI